MSKTMTVTVPMQISVEMLAYVIEGAAFGYWAQYDTYAEPEDILKTDAFAIIAEEPDEFGDKPVLHRLDLAAIKRGLVVMATDYPRQFADINSEQFDSITGDILIQCALFGDTKYG